MHTYAILLLCAAVKVLEPPTVVIIMVISVNVS